jgi:putative Mn2+ efflux pump MntP
MNTSRFFGVVAMFGIGAYFVFIGISAVAWWIFPYPSGADDAALIHIWLYHALAEKIVNMAMTCAIAFMAANQFRPSWKIGLLTGVLSSIVFQVASIVNYIVRFGVDEYIKNNNLLSTMLFTIGLSVLFAFFAVWKDYRSAAGWIEPAKSNATNTKPENKTHE